MIAARARGTVAVLAAGLVLLAACGQDGSAAGGDPTSPVPATVVAPPASSSRVTAAPLTATSAPSTTAPTSSVTGPSVTSAPVTSPSVTSSAGVGAPSSAAPTNAAPTNAAPTNAAPTDPAPAGDQADVPGPDGTTRCSVDSSYTDEPPTGLRPDAASAWGAVLAEAGQVGVDVCLADGKRSRAQQQQIRDEYVRDYGEEMAELYTLPPERSAHVTGIAVDVQPRAASSWLEGTAGRLGFCRTYDNEPWHFEFDASYSAGGCPARLPSPNG